MLPTADTKCPRSSAHSPQRSQVHRVVHRAMLASSHAVSIDRPTQRAEQGTHRQPNVFRDVNESHHTPLQPSQSPQAPRMRRQSACGVQPASCRYQTITTAECGREARGVNSRCCVPLSLSAPPPRSLVLPPIVVPRLGSFRSAHSPWYLLSEPRALNPRALPWLVYVGPPAFFFSLGRFFASAAASAAAADAPLILAAFAFLAASCFAFISSRTWSADFGAVLSST
mmetsp:Transcript_56806/g.112844  ORF Transcript_56806/g.112844 Transcript_56806/m.112844 type:complete len:227 (-) Transcript_56806:360-1040(-)